MMHGHEKSDPVIVAMKPTNNTERSAAEPVEPRTGTKGNVRQRCPCRAQYRVSGPLVAGVHTAGFAVDTRGGSRMRESRTYGSVRGARGNSRPYRNRPNARSASPP
jgi:hypothetical protein